ncbi:MAG: FixH family protein [Chromatiales bacterium]|jgi:hypothetical protein|nr:FixH family protein [Chromatiales bacterium]
MLPSISTSRCALALLAALTIAGCTDWSNAARATVGEYILLLKTDPAPAQVGRTATLSLGIHDARDRTVRACVASLRQFMPEHEMSSDDTLVRMEETRSGVYSAKSAEFSMGGDWRIEVSFDCGSAPQQAHFDLHLDWPE